MPFKSEKQRRYLWANEPDVARKFSDESKASGGMMRKAVANNTKLADYSRMRAGGMIGNGSLTPSKVKNFQDLMCEKSEGC
jgi:hypothetical protein